METAWWLEPENSGYGYNIHYIHVQHTVESTYNDIDGAVKLRTSFWIGITILLNGFRIIGMFGLLGGADCIEYGFFMKFDWQRVPPYCSVLVWGFLEKKFS